jgi:hypothetical protein
VAAGTSLPVVDLGVIGEDYTKVLKVNSVTISSEPFEKKEIGSFSQVVISGQTLSNCEQWKSLLKLSDPAHFEAVCGDGPAPEARTLAGVRSLLAKGLKQEDNSTLILYIAAAAGVVVVIAAIVAIIVCSKKRRRRKRKKAGSEGSYSYSYSGSYSLSESRYRAATNELVNPPHSIRLWSHRNACRVSALCSNERSIPERYVI